MFCAVGAALIRAAAYPHGLTLPAWPDLSVDEAQDWLKWLREAWKLPGFSAAVTSAAPDLAAQITRALAGEPIRTRRLRRLVEATVRYLLRWTTRATPFGHFAGVAPVELGPRATVRWGERHTPVSRPSDRFVAEHTAPAERDLATLRTVPVMTNTLGYPRGGTWVLPCARAGNGRMWDLEIDLTAPVRLALETASSPIAFADLAAKVADELSGGTAEAERLLAALMNAGALLSAIRPPMTVTDPAAHLARHIDLPDPRRTAPEPASADRRICRTTRLPRRNGGRRPDRRGKQDVLGRLSPALLAKDQSWKKPVGSR